MRGQPQNPLVADEAAHHRRRQIALLDMHPIRADGEGNIHLIIDDERHLMRGATRLDGKRSVVPDPLAPGGLVAAQLQHADAALQGGFGDGEQSLTTGGSVQDQIQMQIAGIHDCTSWTNGAS